jgi:hypothetical protein
MIKKDEPSAYCLGLMTPINNDFWIKKKHSQRMKWFLLLKQKKKSQYV